VKIVSRVIIVHKAHQYQRNVLKEDTEMSSRERLSVSCNGLAPYDKPGVEIKTSLIGTVFAIPKNSLTRDLHS